MSLKMRVDIYRIGVDDEGKDVYCFSVKGVNYTAYAALEEIEDDN